MAMQLDKKVRIERRAETQDEAGQTHERWAPVATVWASIRPVSSRHFFAASGERSHITHEIMLRHGIPIRSNDRIVYDGRVFDIVIPMNVDEKNRYIKAMSVENAGI